MEYRDYKNKTQSTSSCNGVLYTIQQGDTLYKLSRRYNVPLSTMMNANPNINVYNLQVGQQICIPGGQNMGSGNTGAGNVTGNRPGAGTWRPNKGDKYPQYQCPACPPQKECPTCPECPAQQPCPEPEPCPACPVCQPCPDCPACPVCEKCPECPVCEKCPDCPPQKECPACPTCPEQQPCPECPTCKECPEQKPCPACPEQKPCPACKECPAQKPCPACPEQKPCPACKECPAQKPCPTCPEQKPCPACKNNAYIYVAPKFEKTYKIEKTCEKPAQMVKPMPCEKPAQVVKPMPCEKPCCTRCEEEDMDMRMYNKRRWNRNAYDYNYGMKFDESCFDRDYMDYTKKMYCGCFREARPCPYRNEGSCGCDCR